jgi:hypothetical protein
MPNPNVPIITPPRVPLVDPRTGMIDRAWYLFFLSLNSVATFVVNDPGIGTSPESLIASYDAALQALAQNVDTQPIPADLSVELQKQIEAAGLTDAAAGLLSTVAEMQKQIDALNTAPPPTLGTVTAVTGTSPVVSSGGIAPDISLDTAYGDTQNPYAVKTANYVLAGPTSGAAALPTFRALVAGDIPTLGYVTAVSVASANGFAGTSSGGATPALTLTTSISGLLFGNGTALAAATINAPLAYSAGTLSITQSDTSTNGYLSSTDWNTFNSKQAALVSGTNIKTVGGVTLLGAGDVSAPSFATVTTSSTTDATTPNTGTTGGFRLRGNATSGTAYLQVTNSTAAAEWGYASIVASGLWTWSGAFTATTITASTQFSGAGTGLTGTASSLSVGGNAATATALQTARNIGGVSFNGTANISLPGVDTTGNQNTSGNAATATNVAGSGITGSRGIPKAAMPAGTVLQVVSATYSTQVSTSSSTYADTGLTATITPTSSSSTILVIVSQSNVAKDSSDTGANIRLLRGASALTTAAIIAAYDNTSGANNVGSVSLNYLDSPATTSATTYKTQVASNMGTGTCYVQTNGSTSYITLMEIAA